jgi:ribosome maturation protein Sdo1
MWLIANPIVQPVAGAVISFGGSVVANLMFYGRMEKSRATREAKRAYNNLMNTLMHATIIDLNHPLHLLPVEIADRMEDLRFAIEDVNPQFDHIKQVQAAIKQAAELRKQQMDKYPPAPPSPTV